MNKQEALKTMGKRVKMYREMLGLSQQELAEKAGYSSRAMICKIETGNADLSQTKLNDVAKALNVSPTEIMFGVEHNPIALTEEEIEFIEMYRKSSSSAKLKAYAELVKGTM